MEELVHKITDPNGIHARPTGILVQKLKEFQCEVTISKNEKTVNAKNVFQVLGLSLKFNDEFTMQATGNDETEAIAEAKKILKEYM